MTDFHARVRASLEELRELGAAERSARLAELEAEDPKLRAEVESLLGHAEHPRTGLEDAAALDAEELAGAFAGASPDESGASPDAAPALIEVEGFRVLRHLASGGMGVVYVAEQERPRRTVALKMLRGDVLSPGLLRRFRQEAEILAKLVHPGIARIYGVGTCRLASGVEQPYFAMELVSGARIHEHAERRDLDTRARVELIIRVCEAVEHAHRNGVIHRDLKPDNVLVADEEGGPGQPKVLDFGVARATDADVALTTMQTNVGQLVGTVPYMSPEQLDGDPSAIDTRSDVYALGVLLFELLAGRLPHELRGRSLPDAVMHVRSTEPTSLGSVDTAFRGDLDTIAAKALARDRDVRYGSAAELAADLRRYLRFEPILARPASTWYQLRQFSRRNRVLVTSAGVIAALMITALIALTVVNLKVVRAEREARLRYEEAEAIANFYDDVLLTVRNLDAGPDVTVLSVVDQMAERIEDELDEHPLVRARVLYTLGSLYFDLGRFNNAVDVHRKSYELRREFLGPDDPDTLESGLQLGMSIGGTNDPVEALPILREALAGAGQQSEEDERRAVGLLTHIGNTLDNNPDYFEEALEVYDEAVARLDAAAIQDGELALVLFSNRGMVLKWLGEFEASEASFLEAFRRADRDPDTPRSKTMGARGNLGSLYADMGRLDEAEEVLLEAYDWLLENLGPGFVGTSMIGGHLALVYREQGRYAESEELYQRGLSSLREIAGPADRYTLRLEQALVEIWIETGRLEEAAELAQEALDRAVEAHGLESGWAFTFEELRDEVQAELAAE